MTIACFNPQPGAKCWRGPAGPPRPGEASLTAPRACRRRVSQTNFTVRGRLEDERKRSARERGRPRGRGASARARRRVRGAPQGVRATGGARAPRDQQPFDRTHRPGATAPARGAERHGAPPRPDHRAASQPHPRHRGLLARDTTAAARPARRRNTERAAPPLTRAARAVLRAVRALALSLRDGPDLRRAARDGVETLALKDEGVLAPLEPVEQC